MLREAKREGPALGLAAMQADLPLGPYDVADSIILEMSVADRDII